jgi:hypothetical protein
VSRQPTSASDSNGFLSRQTAPTTAALTSSSGSIRAVIMITGTLEPRDVSSSLRSSPLIPGMCTSVTMQSHDLSPFAATNSSAEANPRAPYPSEQSDSTSAIRNDSSSSITAIRGSLDTQRPFPRFGRRQRSGGTTIFACRRSDGNYTRVLYSTLMVA